MTTLYYVQNIALPVGFQLIAETEYYNRSEKTEQRTAMSCSEKSVLSRNDKTGCTESDTLPLCSYRCAVRICGEHDVHQA